MKKIIAYLFLGLGSFASNAQEKLSDVNRIVLNTFVPEQAEPLPDQAKSILENKLSQIASIHGMGGETINPRFVLMATIAINSKDIMAGPPQMLAYNISITLYVADALDQKKFNSLSFDAKGVGTNENKAYISAINNLNVRNKDIANFIAEGKNKIINLYNTQCDFIIRDAMSLSNKGQFDDAIYKLSAVPDVCESCYVKCMDTMQYIYQKKIDNECLLSMRNAKTTWMANQNAEGAAQVAEIINSISPFSNCENDANNLMLAIQTKLAADEKARWELQVKKHRDAVRLKELALKNMAEANKRSAENKKEAQKQQFALQKDLQKQQYSLQKADQEAGGFRGVVNSLIKLKMALWRENSDNFIQNARKLDYAKLK